MAIGGGISALFFFSLLCEFLRMKRESKPLLLPLLEQELELLVEAGFSSSELPRSLWLLLSRGAAKDGRVTGLRLR
jgi:hypothetical protein